MLVKDDFDFDNAALYCKIEPLENTRVRCADKIETIITYHAHGIETQNIAQIGDYIIKGSRYGGSYIIRQHDFDTLYIERNGQYHARACRKAIMTIQDCSIMTPWDDVQHVRAGGMIIESGNNVYGVDRFSFIQNYGRADDAGHCFVRLDESLAIQYRESQSRNLQNHMRDILLRESNPHFFI
jgi:hypothetical protein